MGISKKVALALGDVLDEVGRGKCRPAERVSLVLGLLTGQADRSDLENLEVLSRSVGITLDDPGALLERLRWSSEEQFCDLLVTLIELRDPKQVILLP
ncbi:MAG: hypothetical protein ACP5HZ_04535 [Ferrimicrobium sp.]|nr:hypothetical protein [Ferrimicrobium sp.]